MKYCDISLLPAELRLKILGYLSLYQLKMVVRVNRRWREMGEDPFLWKNISLVISSRPQATAYSLIGKILKMKRLSRLRSVEFSSPVPAGQAQAVLSQLTDHESVKHLNIAGSKLSKVQADILGSMVKGLEVLVVTNCRLTFIQIKNILNVISNDSTCKMKELYIGSNDLHQLPPSLLGNCVTKLTTLHCNNTNLMAKQVEALFRAISQEDSILKELNICTMDLSSLSPTLISSSLAKLVLVNLWGTDLTTDQVEAVFNIPAKNNKLTHLVLSNNDLSLIPPTIFSSFICRLIEAEMCLCDLTPMQVTMLLTNIATKDCQLTKLDINGNPEAFNQLPQQLLETAENKLNSLELGYFERINLT